MAEDFELKEIIKDSELINDYELSQRIQGAGINNKLINRSSNRAQIYSDIA